MPTPASTSTPMPASTPRLYEVFHSGLHEEIAVFGPDSKATRRFCDETGMAQDCILHVNDAADLLKLDPEIPLVLFPLWWRSAASPAVITAAKLAGRRIVTAFPL